MTKHTDSSGNAQTGVREGRIQAARDWRRTEELKMLRGAVNPYSAKEVDVMLAEYDSTECSRLASRVEELEKQLVYARGLLWKLRNTAKSALTDAKFETDEWLAGAHAEEKE